MEKVDRKLEQLSTTKYSPKSSIEYSLTWSVILRSLQWKIHHDAVACLCFSNPSSDHKITKFWCEEQLAVYFAIYIRMERYSKEESGKKSTPRYVVMSFQNDIKVVIICFHKTPKSRFCNVNLHYFLKVWKIMPSHVACGAISGIDWIGSPGGVR